MTTLTQVETAMSHILTQRAKVLAKETGAIRRVRKFEGADLLHMLVFGWMQHPDASLEQLSSTAAIGAVQVSDTAVHKRFTKECATFLHAILEELLKVVVQAEMVTPPKVLRRFTAVVVEDSSTITLPDELAQLWRGCGGNQRHTAAAIKLHVRLRAAARTGVGTGAHGGALFGSPQSPGPGGVARGEPVCDGSRLLLPARDRPAPSAASLYVDALARGHQALRSAAPAALAGEGSAAATSGADERAARARWSARASADAAVDAARPQEDCRPTTRGLES